AIWLQDLWPESLKATGFISNNILLKMIGWMVRGIYSSADTLLIQSKAFYKPVLQYTNADKIVYFPNAYSDKQSEIKKRVKDEGEFGKLINVLEQKFCLTFAGNLGTAQSLPTILLAAEKLKKINDFCIVFVGTGSMSTWLAKQKKERGLDNIYLAGHYPNETMPEIFKRSKALLVTLKKDEIFEYTIPSKVQAYLASGRPIIAALDGEGGRIINEAKAGIVCAAEDADGLVLSVRRLIGMSDNERSEFGRAGREYYLANFEMKKQCQALIDILERRL
ncbi:MAG: glycosyltransferase family 4 protein, partial [Candidatus Thioglobus sp.]